MKVFYCNIETIDCTADPHPVGYPDLEKALDDILRVCESNLLWGIEKVALYEKDDKQMQRGYESDYYTDHCFGDRDPEEMRQLHPIFG